MINASANGWINKFLSKSDHNDDINELTEKKLYKSIRKTGFVYGHSVRLPFSKNISTKGWTEQELAKITLIDSLFMTYKLTTNNYSKEKFIQQLSQFYRLNSKKSNIETDLTEKSLNKDFTYLEKVVDVRVQTNNNIVAKNFSHILTNAFLFLDVISFQHFLKNNRIKDSYFQKIELSTLQIISLCLKQKSNPSKYDELLIKLFENSVRYNKIAAAKITQLEDISWNDFPNEFERFYLLDVASMAVWSDGILEEKERNLLLEIAGKLEISTKFCLKSFEDLHEYILTNKDVIPYFNYSNPVKHFYVQASQTVQILITRNRKRLVKELSQSGELMVLLAQSTQRDLNDIEKKKVKNQLLDICKSVPSLTIFILPGGSLLLPILIKFIPKMLPSAFNENLDNE